MERYNDRGSPSRHTKLSSEPKDPGQGPWLQPEGLGQMEEAGDHRGSPLPQAHTAAVGRLPVYPPARDPAPDALIPAD
jgi:hypothetical protein